MGTSGGAAGARAKQRLAGGVWSVECDGRVRAWERVKYLLFKSAATGVS